MLHFAVAVAQHHTEIAVALVREQILLASVDVEGGLGDLGASVEQVKLALIESAARVGRWGSDKATATKAAQ